MLAKNSILETIHETPLLKLDQRLVPADAANIYAKLEYFNPCGSVKDRICLAMVEGAVARGLLKVDDPQNPPTVVEATSGNTGLGLAMVCAAKKYRLIIVMPENYSVERRYLLKRLGAELVLTPAKEEMTGALKKAQELVKKIPNSFLPNQFSNPDNPQSHSEHTAQEILQDMIQDMTEVVIQDMTEVEIHAFVAGIGTAGTFTGVGSILKKRYPKIKLIAVEPAEAAVLSGGKPQVHGIQGIGAGFIPENLDRSLVTSVITVTDQEAYNSVRVLASKVGVLVGVSSGANYWASLKIAKELGPHKNVVTVFPDKGERYFSVERS